MESVDFTKFTIGGVYVSYALANELINSGIAALYPPIIKMNITWDRDDVAFYWDMINSTLQVLTNTIVTPEDDLARECMMIPDNAGRLIYLNNL